MKKEQYVKPSDFYWGIGMILTIILLDIYYSSGKLMRYWWLSLFLFIFSMIISHNKKIRNKFDYKEVKND